MGVIAIAAFRPKAGQEEALMELTREHVPILRGLGLATERPVTAMRAQDGTIVEVFEWVSHEAVREAHSNPVVLEMWMRYEAACEYLSLGDLPEGNRPFPNFEPIDL